MPDFTTIPIPPESFQSACPLPGSLCAVTATDPFLTSVVAWATLQLSWTLILLASQLWQVSRQMTTFEVSNLGRYGFMGGRAGSAGLLASQMGHAHHHGHSPAAEGEGHAGHAHKHRHTMCGGSGGFIMQLTGLELFTKGRGADGLARAAKAANPFDLGILGNCKDFWTTGKELGVDYARAYDVPLEGFRAAKVKREREEEEEERTGGGAGDERRKKRGLFMGWIGRTTSRGSYEPLSQV